MAGLDRFVATRITEDLLRQIRLAALAEGVSMSHLIRQAVESRTREISARAMRRDHRTTEAIE